MSRGRGWLFTTTKYVHYGTAPIIVVRTTVPQYHSVSKQTPRRPFGLLLLACLTAAAAQAAHQPPSLLQPANLGQNCSEGGGY